MLPTLRPGQLCIFLKKSRYKNGDVVLAKAAGRQVVKRVYVEGATRHLRGDNRQASTNYRVGRDVVIAARLIWPKHTRFHAFATNE